MMVNAPAPPPMLGGSWPPRGFRFGGTQQNPPHGSDVALAGA